MIDLTKLNDHWIIVLNAFFKESYMIKCENVNKVRREIALPFRQERKRRGLKKISVYDDLEPMPTFYDFTKPRPVESIPEGFSLVEYSDREIQIWEALASHIADYSMLGSGIRKYIDALYFLSTQELDKRKLPWNLLEELKFES